MKHTLNKWIAGILLVPVIAAGVFFVTPQEAEAQFPTIEIPGSILFEAALAQVAKEGSVITAGFSLDTLAYLMADIALEVITADIISWINSGFEGSPAFVQNPSAFLGTVADYAAGAFIEDLGAGFLCSAFDVDVRAAIELSYYQAEGGDGSLRDKYQCTLSEIEGNIEDFLGDFREGDLEDFFAVSLEPTNNPYEVFRGLRLELEARTSEAEMAAEREFSVGNGFLSHRECRTRKNPETGEDIVEEPPHCTGDILTPGAIIENQLGDVLSIGQNRLTVADEFNEIASALLTQIVRQALGSAGLAGAARSVPQGGRSGGTDDETLGRIDQIEEQIEASVLNGESSLSAITQTLNIIERGIEDLEEARPGCDNPTLVSNLQSLRTQKTSLEESQDAIREALPTLRRLLREIRAAEGSAALSNILTQYQNLARQGGVVTGAQKNVYEQNVETMRATVETYVSSAEKCEYE